MTAPGHDEIARAVRLLRAGELVAFPTETVYGLGADASNPEAVARIFSAKGRPADHPVIVHLWSSFQVEDWAREFPPQGRRLAAAFWPGPLTLVLPRASRVPDVVTGGQDTVALRVPSHPVARALLEAFGGGIAAPSANRHGRVSPTRAAHVHEELGDRVGMILDGGECEVGLESTIVSLAGPQAQLLRPGKVARAELEQVIGPLAQLSRDAPRVPGSMKSHYAPATPVELIERGAAESRCAELGGQAIVAVLAQRMRPEGLEGVVWRKAETGAAAYGHDLYADLRALDAVGASRILVERVPASAEWTAVRDRLERAAAADTPDAP